jgi:hypothetical protein
VQIDAFAVRLRARSNMEAADLGVRLCQNAAREVFTCYWAVGIPTVMLAFAAFQMAPWLPILIVWLAKPWLDRTILFVLSRAAFGQTTSLRDLWLAKAAVWGGQLLLTWTLRRLSPWRSFTQPVYQLEGLRGRPLRRRVAQIRRGRTGAAALVAFVFGLTEELLLVAVVSCVFWLTPEGYTPELRKLWIGDAPAAVDIALQAAYAATVLFLEPFFVAAGFAMYLNRRAELEAWDIEQEFRRAFSV